MKKKSFLQGLSSEVERSAALHTQHGLRLSAVMYEPPSKFQANPLNSEFFQAEKQEYLEQLTTDIRERGIVVPIIAKPDGTLLAGHNRLHIAQELSLSLVPVQYVEQKLSAQEEKKFVINDNLLRRQLTQPERLELYRKLYTNFDERISSRAHHRPQKNDIKKNKVDTVHLNDNNDSEPLTAAVIARDTGQKKATVQKQLQRIKDDISFSTPKVLHEKKPVKQSSKNVSGYSQNLRAFKKNMQALQDRIDNAEGNERKQMIKELELFLKSLKQAITPSSKV